MNDKEWIEEFSKRFGLQIVVYTEEDYIDEKAWKLGARISLNLCSPDNKSLVDFAFDDKDRLVGYYTSAIDSFVDAKYLNKQRFMEGLKA